MLHIQYKIKQTLVYYYIIYDIIHLLHQLLTNKVHIAKVTKIHAIIIIFLWH